MFLPGDMKCPAQKYDYIIGGSGIAGNTCAYILQKKGHSGIILERESSRVEKICGGGIPMKALSLLDDIGMDLTPLYDADVSIIKGDCTFWGEKETLNLYDDNKFSIGCRRKIFDDFLLKQAQYAGAKIKWGCPVGEIETRYPYFIIHDYCSRNIILAVGARGLDRRYTPGQSIGISAQILGTSDLSNSIFYFFYYDKNHNHYFWIFPIGQKLWNVGLWYRHPESDMMKSFRACWGKYINKFFSNYTIISTPRGEFCGNIDLNTQESVYAIGDYAGCNNEKNGGGIYRAIKSAVYCAKGIV